MVFELARGKEETSAAEGVEAIAEVDETSCRIKVRRRVEGITVRQMHIHYGSTIPADVHPSKHLEPFPSHRMQPQKKTSTFLSGAAKQFKQSMIHLKS